MKRDKLWLRILKCIHTNQNSKKLGYQRYMMKIRGKLAQILKEIAPEVY